MQKRLIGDKNIFAIEYAFLDDSQETEIAMYVYGKNILAFERNEETLTTRWNLDELAEWFRQFLNTMAEDPFPVDCEGQYAAQKDDTARSFDSDNDKLFDAYYDKLYDWNLRHRWHPASSGAILADVYFQLVGDHVEISWNNNDSEESIRFLNLNGGAAINRDLFCSVVCSFLEEYASHWS